MSDQSITTLLAPQSRVKINIRPGTMDDLPFMDSLQKQNSKALGYFPTKQFEGYLAMGGVLVAETGGRVSSPAGGADGEGSAAGDSRPPERVGYVISRDRYLKRDELGVIYQLCVSPGGQRKLVGASLIQAVFERSAYGCRLFCCWCAQDLAANRFWESLGFSPIAFRGGSDKKKRVHLFWQKRIRRGDVSSPWWFPSKTESGALRADRLVLPIPHGLHWSDPMPVMVPRHSAVNEVNGDAPSAVKALPSRERTKRQIKTCPTSQQPPTKRTVQFGRPGAVLPEPAAPVVAPTAKPKREKREKIKCEPKLISAARELRDRWLEQVNAGHAALSSAGKYDVAKAIDARPAVKRLDAA